MAHKAGFVSIIGKPNAGKSTLMNALVGEKMSIITPKAQTPRHRILGIVDLYRGRGCHTQVVTVQLTIVKQAKGHYIIGLARNKVLKVARWHQVITEDLG